VPLFPSVFLGAPLVALALLGAAASRAGRVLGSAALVCVWLALGPSLGAEPLLRVVPIWGSLRYAEKLVGPLSLCVAVLAGLGVDRAAAAPSRRLAAPALVLAALIGAAAAMLAWTRGADDLLRAAGAGDAAEEARQHLALGFAHAALGLALLGGLLATAASAAGLRRHLPTATAALIWLQSVAGAPFALHAGSPGVRETAPLRGIAARDSPVRIVTPLRARADSGPPGLDESDRVVAVESRMAIPPYNVSARLDHLETYTGLLPRQLVVAYGSLYKALGPAHWQALRRYGLTHVVLRRPVSVREWVEAQAAVAGGRQVLTDAAWGFTVWEVPHRPWASFAEQVVAVGSIQDAVAALVESARRGGRDAILEGPSPPGVGPGRVLAQARGVESLRIEAESAGDGVLVLNDAFWPGWRATIDGRPVTIWRADALVRAVMWPAGRHVLEMRYDPPEVAVGLAVTVAGAVGVILLAVPRLRRRPPVPELPSNWIPPRLSRGRLLRLR
jgi:hypothetical protein